MTAALKRFLAASLLWKGIKLARTAGHVVSRTWNVLCVYVMRCDVMWCDGMWCDGTLSW